MRFPGSLLATWLVACAIGVRAIDTPEDIKSIPVRQMEY